MDNSFEVIVVGAGHAGCEAALAAARMGRKTSLFNMDAEKIAFMSCNPAIGGLAKGQLVKEIDALGGEMARAIDATGIQFRRLNTRKGPAVRSSRAQADREAYRLYMKNRIVGQAGLTLVPEPVTDIIVEDSRVKGVVTQSGLTFHAGSVVITPGTFLNGIIYVGKDGTPAGRIGEPPAGKLSESLKRIGLNIGRLKTCTPPRLDRSTCDFSGLRPQPGDEKPLPFSFDTASIERPQILCHITHTNPRTHEIIRDNLHCSAYMNDITSGAGPRYCPSIEDKVINFQDRQSHQIFLEPEGVESGIIYPNGLFTGLPEEVQYLMAHSIKGLENVKIIQPGYTVEYDFVVPTQLKATLETNAIKGLFLAGQINGTSGYEEAAAQGILAGINAALLARDEEPVSFDRSQAYIGVMVDDLITRGTSEPYRMFTSRAEYRLLLREDNADIRLRDTGHRIGLVPDETYERFLAKKEAITAEVSRLERTRVRPEERVNKILAAKKTPLLREPTTLAHLLRRPELTYEDIMEIESGERVELSEAVIEEVQIQVKYEGYLQRERAEVKKFRSRERMRIPADTEYDQVHGLSREAREKLESRRPGTIGQASRIPGITPAAVTALQIYLKTREAAGTGP